MRSPVLLVATAVTVAELGDKTQLATATLAADSADPVFTWIGATLGLIAAGAVGVVVGRFLGDRIPRSTLSYVSGGLFLAVGVVMLATAL
ncbi:MAG: TMEM165/GDT1 family protein [Ilumatobacteraceae bacterium]